MIRKLPYWVLVEKFPAFNDLESLTAIEQTARIYGKMNELIESYNKYVEEINNTINEFELEKNEDVKTFICSITTLTHDYINSVDMKIAHQDRKLAEVYERFSDDVINTVKTIIAELKETGKLDNALIEAVGNLNTKVDSFIQECNQYKADLEKYKNQLNTDFDSALQNLDGEYKAAKSQLATDYNNTKSQLNADYVSKSEDLEEDYNTIKSQLANDYSNTKSQLAESVEGYTDMYENKGILLYDSTENGTITDKSDNTVDNIMLYKVVIVNVKGVGDIICTVSKSKIIDKGVETPIFRVAGSGSGAYTGNSTIWLGSVNLVVDEYSWKVLENKSQTMILTVNPDGNNEHTISISNSIIGDIYGLV